MESTESRVRWYADVLKCQIGVVREVIGQLVPRDTQHPDVHWLLDCATQGVDTLMEEVQRAFKWRSEDPESGADCGRYAAVPERDAGVGPPW